MALLLVFSLPLKSPLTLHHNMTLTLQRTKKWLKKLREDTANAKKGVKPKKTEGAATKPVSAKTEILKCDELTRLEDNAEQVADRFKLGCECASNCFDVSALSGT